MKTLFLHLSDLHYRRDRPEHAEVILAALFQDLATHVAQEDSPYLVFSGDFVFAGDDEQSYNALAASLISRLDRAGFPTSRRIVVPGNHDVSQPSLTGQRLRLRNGALDTLTNELSFNESLQTLTEQYISQQLAHYVQFERLFATMTCCQAAIGGAGWDLAGDIGVYCLNTALCSSAGLRGAADQVISDKGRLHVDTRSLHQWLATTPSQFRLLVMHHPFEWLSEWAQSELLAVATQSFDIVLSGHAHTADASLTHRLGVRTVQLAAPALFTTKTDTLAYSLISVDSSNRQVGILYRQWVPTRRSFVNGTLLSGSDSGSLTFDLGTASYEAPEPVRLTDTMAVLQTEFDAALISVSSTRIWAERDLASRPETDAADAVVTSVTSFVETLRTCVIRAPSQFGLTTLGRFIALEHFRQRRNGRVVAMLDAASIGAHRQGVLSAVTDRCTELATSSSLLDAIVLDNCQDARKLKRLLDEIRNTFPEVRIIALHSVDNAAEISEAVDSGYNTSFEVLYLWALNRGRIRELVTAFVYNRHDADENRITAKVVADLDGLNIHRTPMHCLLLARLAAELADDSPVNRTEVISRVLNLLFYRFDQIPRYATRPDLKDCEYVLGHFCAALLRQGRSSFSKDDFIESGRTYCGAQLIDVDIELLFAFLAYENILVRRHNAFEFRFAYWLYYFAAHRMHHDASFAEFILADRRYAQLPDLLEFYAGIDRRRQNAVEQLTRDLADMNAGFVTRTGIPTDFNVYSGAEWTPSDDAIAKMQEELQAGMAESTLPTSVKDAIADRNYDRSMPYRQELADFIEHSTVRQLMGAMRGAARVLRNSDHVTPEAKRALLEEILRSWVKIGQLLMMLAPILAINRRASFEDARFVLSDDFSGDNYEEILVRIVESIPTNIVHWYQEDLFSRKLGLLLADHVKTHAGRLSEFLTLILMARQRPPGWDKQIERFIVRENKNSFYLGQVFSVLDSERMVSVSTERTRQELRRLAAMAIAKHSTGSKHPNTKLIERAAQQLDESRKDDRK